MIQERIAMAAKSSAYLQNAIDTLHVADEAVTLCDEENVGTQDLARPNARACSLEERKAKPKLNVAVELTERG